MRKVLIYKISCVHWRAGRLFPSAVYRKGKAGECFSMLDSEKQKHRDHCKASVARSVLISATERLSELRSSELSANGRSWMHGSSRKRSRSRVLAFRRQHTQKNNRWFPFRTCARKPPQIFISQLYILSSWSTFHNSHFFLFSGKLSRDSRRFSLSVSLLQNLFSCQIFLLLPIFYSGNGDRKSVV